jgi:hypothetical protein
MKLYESGKLSTDLAAKIADVPRLTFIFLLESVLEIPCCFAGLPNPASFEAVLLLVGLDFLTPSVRTGVAIQASDKPISNTF